MSLQFDRNRLRTVHLVPLTAFDSSDRLDEDVQAEHIATLYAAGMRAFLPSAGTSEFHSLSADEIVQSVRITREASGHDATVFAPVGLQLGHAEDVAVRSLDAGADGILFMPLSHPYLSDSGALDYYHAVVDRAQCPALIYKKGPIPSNRLLLDLAAHPDVVGVKYAVNELHEFRKVVLADGDRIEWLCGSAERFAPYYMMAGATGYTTGAGNLCPHLTLAMHDAFSAGEFQLGVQLQNTLLPIEDYRARSGDSYNISMLKHAMTVLGKDFGPPRPPQRRVTAEERAEIEEMMQPVLAAEADLKDEFASVGLTAR